MQLFDSFFSHRYLQNNMLSGNIPEEFSNKKIIFKSVIYEKSNGFLNYRVCLSDGNFNLHLFFVNAASLGIHCPTKNKIAKRTK